MTEISTKHLIKIQVAVAILAVAVTAVSFYQLGPLTEKQAELKAEIISLEAKRNELRIDNETLARGAKPVEKSSGNVEAWLYLGRVNSSGQWAPPSEGVTPSPIPTAAKEFRIVSVKKNATLVGNIESVSAPSSSNSSIEAVQLVKAGTDLPVLEVKNLPSIGGASLVWVKVSAPANTILEVSNK